MSVVFTGTNQGRFISDAMAKTIKLRSDVDWMWVKNETVSYAAGAGTGAEFYWQRGMAQGRGTVYLKTAVTSALQVGQIAANAGFYLVDSSVNVPSASVDLTEVDDSAVPVVDTANTSLLSDGDVVRLFNVVDGTQLNGIDFTIGGIIANTSFTLANMAEIVTTGNTTGTWRRIPYDPLYYPVNRYITKVVAAANTNNALVTLSVTHGYTVGQIVRFVVPTVTALAFGMPALNGLQGTIVAIGTADANGSTNTITVDIDVTSFGTFAWPLTLNPGFTPAQIVPVGANTAIGLQLNANVLADATTNTGYIGIKLMAGINSPAGVANNVIYWVAGKSFSVDNQ